MANDIIENKQVQTTAFDAEDCVTIMEMMEAGEARMKKLARLFKSRGAKCCSIDLTRAKKAELCVKTEKSPNGGKTFAFQNNSCSKPCATIFRKCHQFNQYITAYYKVRCICFLFLFTSVWGIQFAKKCILQCVVILLWKIHTWAQIFDITNIFETWHVRWIG